MITGFGRTGPMFACEAEGVSPDVMTVAKGLTAGYAPMGAVLLSDKVYNGIADGAAPDAVIGHGYTYSGHPVSAAVGLEVIRLYESGILANGQAVGSCSKPGSRPWPATRWWAMPALAACSALWNSSRTRRRKRPSPPP